MNDENLRIRTPVVIFDVELTTAAWMICLCHRLRHSRYSMLLSAYLLGPCLQCIRGTRLMRTRCDVKRSSFNLQKKKMEKRYKYLWKHSQPDSKREERKIQCEIMNWRMCFYLQTRYGSGRVDNNKWRQKSQIGIAGQILKLNVRNARRHQCPRLTHNST